LEEAQQQADERLTTAQRWPLQAREAADELSRRAAEAGATHAALVERAGALGTEVQRLEEAGRGARANGPRRSPRNSNTAAGGGGAPHDIASGEVQLDADVRELDSLRQHVMTADEAVTLLRGDGRPARVAIKGDQRGRWMRFGRSSPSWTSPRATAEAELSPPNLAHTCEDAVNASLHEVVAEVEISSSERARRRRTRPFITSEDGDDERRT